MNKIKTILILVGLCLIGIFTACSPGEYAVEDLPRLSYAQIDFTGPNPLPIDPSGSSPISGISTINAQTVYVSDVSGHQCEPGGLTTIKLNMKRPSMVQLAVEADGTSEPSSFDIQVNSNQVGELTVNQFYQFESDSITFGLYQIDKSVLESGENIIELTLKSGSPIFERIKFLPQEIHSDSGQLTTTLFTQFGETNQVSGALSDLIWTRAYGLSEEIEMIPGPTLYFNPGDLVQMNMINRLNPGNSHVLQKFDLFQGDSVMIDEVLANAGLRGEINIPHNLNNTNLHVHGLHVDPSKDDVTIVIVPEGESTEGYDAPHSNHPVSSISELDEFSVADQSVKPGAWNYQYKIPNIHLPGTHWFHPHKHGATSAQVENGLAGTLVIQEADSNAIVPFPGRPGAEGGMQTNYDLQNWRNRYDRVFAIQEITNYAFNFGKGNRKGEAAIAKAKGSSELDLTVNGNSDLSIAMAPGQLERWRLVNAGTNHRAFSHVWLGKQIGDPKDSVYRTVPIYLVAVDGITIPKKVAVTADKPALLAPGNRSDFLVQLEEVGTYVLFKNYEIPGITIQDAQGKPLFSWATRKQSTFWPYISNNKNNPYIFKKYGKNPIINYLGFTRKWINGNRDTTYNIVPNIRVFPTSDEFLDVTYSVAKDFKSGSTAEFAPVAFGVSVPAGNLITANVELGQVNPQDSPKMPSDSYLSSISPATADWTPKYVSRIDPKTDVLQSRPVMFDVSGLGVDVTDTASNQSVSVRQFTLNGRFFELNDPIGNTRSDTIIGKPYLTPYELAYSDSVNQVSDSTAIVDSDDKMKFVHTVGVGYPDPNAVGDRYYFVNPSYYQPITVDKVIDKDSVYKYAGTGQPSWELLTGIKNETGGIQRTSIINTSSDSYNNNQDNLPNLPLATTAEEWILVNNSDVSHPFHIHINPFFVVEVGQLSYEKIPNSNQYDWYMRAVTASGETPRPKINDPNVKPGDVVQGEIGVDGIVGNWWDTIVIPAHGYVKVRYWFNVPRQDGSEPGAITVHDDQNRVGIWVYHCHILRHEDRGMMMPVITQKSK